MFFAEDATKDMTANRAAMAGKRDALLDLYLARTYVEPRAKEFAEHGLSRRLRTMTHCIDSVFTIVPPERTDPPSTDELIDAVVFIQAFVFNTFASLDNLAWIWVCEKKLTKENGDAIPHSAVGLGRKCKVVRRSLPDDIQKHLKSLDPWMEHLENFRHALAHRIPLYIPPRVIQTKDLPAYQQLEKRKARASRRGNFKHYEQLEAEQEALTRFEPVMMHSIPDNSKRIVFHPQLLTDFNTVHELALKMHAALDLAPNRGAVDVVRSTLAKLKNASLRFFRSFVLRG